MNTEIRDAFYEQFPLEITSHVAEAIIKYIQSFEVKGNNAAAFNSPYLAMPLATFANEDRDSFFNLMNVEPEHIDGVVRKYQQYTKLFGVSKSQYSKIVDTSIKNALQDKVLNAAISLSELRKVISGISTVDKNFKVVSDPFNLFMSYLIHKALTSSIDEKLRYKLAFKCVMFLQYKFFSSVVRHRFIYSPDPDVMRATYEKLSAKFAIKQYGTWKAVMEARATGMLGPDSPHIKALHEYTPDEKVLYFITDLQTRIRSHINIFVEEFMKTKENHDSLGDYSSMGNDLEGAKVLLDQNGGYEHIFNNVYQDTMSLPRFIDQKTMTLVNGLFKSINVSMLQRLLTYFSDYCVRCAHTGKSKGVAERNGQIVYTGGYDIVINTLQNTYHYCISNHVDMTKPRDILFCARDVYSSSRIADLGIIQIRNTMDMVVQDAKITSRDATRASLRIALVLYLVILSFKYM